MREHSAESNGTDTAGVSLQAEVEELRRRLAALEARAPAQAAGRASAHVRPTAKGLGLLAACVVLAGATVVFGQGAVEALFVSREGNVGIGTPSPSNRLTVAGNADFSGNVGIGTPSPVSKLHIRGNYLNKGAGGFALDASDNNNPEQYILRINPFALGDSRVGYQFQTKSTIGGTRTPLTFDNEGNVGIGTDTPASRLSVAGNADVSGTLTTRNSLRADGQSFLFTGGSTDNSSNVVLRKDGSGAYLFPWGTGTGDNNVFIGGKAATNLSVSGDLNVGGRLNSPGRYQRNDESERNYPVSPRYHVSLTANAYGGRTRQIPQQLLNDLCGDEDGCEVRIAMTRWSGDSGTQAASKSALFYYSQSDGQWRTNAGGGGGESSGVDGRNGTEHIMNAWGTCYFTDGSYNEYKNNGDNAIGLSLLVYNEYKYQDRTCELTLID